MLIFVIIQVLLSSEAILSLVGIGIILECNGTTLLLMEQLNHQSE